jgi:GNAT superfamily N-acetyltransferase
MSCPFIIRDARREDTDTIVALWREMMDEHADLDSRFRFSPDAEVEFARHVRRSMRSSGAHLFVGVYGGSVIGYVFGEMQSRPPIYPTGRYGFISDLCVTKRFRRNGLGRALTERMLRWFSAEGATAVELFAADRNEVARAFWASMGFEPFLQMLRIELDRAGPGRIGFRFKRADSNRTEEG